MSIGPYERTGDTDRRVGLRPPRNDSVLSFRGAERRGNLFFFQEGSVPYTVVEVLLRFS